MRQTRGNGRAWLPKDMFLLSTRPQNRTTVEVRIHSSAPSCHDGLTGSILPSSWAGGTVVLKPNDVTNHSLNNATRIEGNQNGLPTSM